MPPAHFEIALRQLERFARDLAFGRASHVDLPAILATLGFDAPPRSRPLLEALRTSAPAAPADEHARRKFFHAARAVVSLHRHGAQSAHAA